MDEASATRRANDDDPSENTRCHGRRTDDLTLEGVADNGLLAMLADGIASLASTSPQAQATAGPLSGHVCLRLHPKNLRRNLIRRQARVGCVDHTDGEQRHDEYHHQDRRNQTSASRSRTDEMFHFHDETTIAAQRRRAVVSAGGTPDLVWLSDWLAQTPMGPLYKRHGSADRELAALIASA